MRKQSLLILLALGILLATSAANAQGQAVGGRFAVGAGVGYGRLVAGEIDQRLDDVILHARAGLRLSSMVLIGLEAGRYATNDEDPRPSDLSVGEGGMLVVNRRPEVLRTGTIVASVQVGRTGGIYLRPGIGIGRHAFASYGPGYAFPEPEFTTAERSYEAGLAASLAAGHEVRLSRRLTLGLEAIAAWSGGEDSSTARRVLGVQVVPLLTF